MNDDQLDDLKQFITATVSQATADMATKDDISSIENKLDNIQSAIGDAISTSNEIFDEKIDDHDRRISTLELKSTSK